MAIRLRRQVDPIPIQADREQHSVAGAMARGELDEDEAYFVLRYAGHYGYSEAIKRLEGRPLRRLRRWFIRFGWESPELCQWDLGWPEWTFHAPYTGKLDWSPTPVSMFGHRLTFQNFGVILVWRGGYACFTRSTRYSWDWQWYWSPNGTPHHVRTHIYWTRRAQMKGLD